MRARAFKCVGRKLKDDAAVQPSISWKARNSAKKKKRKTGETVGVLAAASKAVSGRVAHLADLFLQQSIRAEKIKKMCSLVQHFPAASS